MRVRLIVVSCVLLLLVAAPSLAQTDRSAPMTGTFSASTGTHNDEGPRAVKIESGVGPYRRAVLGTGLGLDPQPIAYLGLRLGLPSTKFPIELVIEFCEVDSVNEALLRRRCPTSTWVLEQTVIFQANYEPIDNKQADSAWFDPSKQYRLIWRDGDRVISYSTPIKFDRRAR